MKEISSEQNIVKKEPHPPSPLLAVLPILFLLVSMVITTVYWGMDPHMSVLMSVIVAAFVAKGCGYTWVMLTSAMITAISRALEAILILLCVGMLIGSWMLCGSIPTMIYYGLLLIAPAVFLPVGLLLMLTVSLTTGSSWSSSGTVGVALMGIAAGLGINPAIAAGMVISGAYCGDKWSPLSDSTVLAAATCEVPLYLHVQRMIRTTLPSLIIAFIVYSVISFNIAGTGYDPVVVDNLLRLIDENFTVSWLLVIPALFIVFSAIVKIPPIPSLLTAALLAGVLGMILQGITVHEFLETMHFGYDPEPTGYELYDRLVSRGGFDSMMWTVSLIMFALAFGGILDKCGFVESMLGSIIKRIRRIGTLMAMTVLTGIACDFVLTDQYLSIIMTGRLYAKNFDDYGLHRSMLSRSCEDGATLWSPMCPWNGCGVYQAATLGVPTLSYFPYAILNLVNPIVAIIFNYIGYGVVYNDPDKPQGTLRKKAK